MDKAEQLIDWMEKCEHNPEMARRQAGIIKVSSIFYRKDRGQSEINQANEKIFSANSGIMKSLAGNPMDELGVMASNRYPDINLIDGTKVHGYLKSSVHVLSGDTQRKL